MTKITKNIIRFKYLMHTPTSPPNTRHPQQTPTAADNIPTLDSSLSSNSIVLDEVKLDKYLGVILDNKLSFNQHIDEIVNKTTKLLNLCRRNLHMCDQLTKEIAYKTIVRPHLEYASTAWNPYTARNIDKIESVQRRAARIILINYNYAPDSHLTYQIQHTLKWIPLQHRRTLYDLVTFYKIRANYINISFPETVRQSPHQADRYLHIQYSHSDAYNYHFFTRTVRMWNLIPVQAITTDSVNTFRTLTANWMTPIS